MKRFYFLATLMIAFCLVLAGCQESEDREAATDAVASAFPEVPDAETIAQLELLGVKYLGQDSHLLEQQIPVFTFDQYAKYESKPLPEFLLALKIPYIKYHSSVGYYTIAKCEYGDRTVLWLMSWDTGFRHTTNITFAPTEGVCTCLDAVSEIKNGMTFSDVVSILGPGYLGQYSSNDPTYHWISDNQRWYLCKVVYSNWWVCDYYVLSL